MHVPLRLALRRLVIRARRRVHPWLDLVLPTDCFCCGSPVDALQQDGACSRCWAALRPIGDAYCRRCGLPCSSATDLLGGAHGTCVRCLLRPPALDAVCPAVRYDAVARSFVLRAKFGRRRELFARMGVQMAVALRRAGLAAGVVEVVPVPSHPWSDLRRGFRPAREIGRRVAAELGLKFGGGRIRRSLVPLGRAKSLSARSRRELLRSAVRARGRVEKGPFLLVDDVMTTGATLEACARALRSAGAAEIRAGVWARAGPPGEVADFVSGDESEP